MNVQGGPRGNARVQTEILPLKQIHKTYKNNIIITTNNNNNKLLISVCVVILPDSRVYVAYTLWMQSRLIYASLFRQKQAVKKQANTKNKDKYIAGEITQYQ